MRSRRARFVALGAIAIALIVATAVTLTRDGGGNGSATDRPAAGHLGPTPGPPTAEGYIQAKSAHLDGMAAADPNERTGALVSFNKYMSARSAQALVRDMRAVAVFTRFPGSEQELIRVETTVAGAAADRAADVRKQLELEIASLSDQVAQAEGAEREDLQRSLDERRATVAKVKADCPCVYALAVEGAQLADLHALSKREVVRLVDVPEKATQSLDGWELAPVVPRA